MNKKIYDNTQIFIKTTGIFLEELIHNESLNYNYIIIDEIHERDVNIDLILVIIKSLIEKKDDIKIILMSATIDVNSFYNYFKIFGNYENLVIQIRQKIFYVQEYFIENIEKEYNLKEKQFFENQENVKFSEELFEYIKYIILDIFKKTNNENGILIFLPGLYQIQLLEDYLNNELDESINTNNRIINLKDETKIYIFHSEFKELQKEILKNIKDKRKIILASNIAESSITIPNITYIIDFCLTKEKNYDLKNESDYLKLNWCSKANLKQREGRIGRLSNGIIYRLIHKKFYEQLKETTKPDILRNNLDKIILKIKLYSKEEPYNFLKKCINCPNENEVKQSIKKLQLLGALSMTNDENLSGNLTNLGKIFVELPIEIQYSRLIILTSFFNLIDIGIIISAICSQDNKMFNSILLKNRYELYQIKKEPEFKNNNCDFICSYNIYWKWKKNFGLKMQNNEFDIDLKDLNNNDINIQEKFVKKYGLNLKVLIEILKTEADLKKRLYHLGKFYKNEKQINQIDFSNKENVLLFKFALLGAFYQNLIYGINLNDSKNYEIKYEQLKRTIDIKNTDNINVEDLTTCLNSIISPDKINQIEQYDNYYSIIVNTIDSIVKLFYISNNDIIKLNIKGKSYNCKLYYKIKRNFIAEFYCHDLIIDNESINYKIIESGKKALKKYFLVSDKCIIKRNNKMYSNNICFLPDIKMFDELALIIFTPDLIFESDLNKQYYDKFKIKGNIYNSFFFKYYFGTGDLLKINKLRENMNKLSLLPLYIKKEDSDKKIIEVENKEFKYYQNLVCNNVKSLLNEERIEILRDKEQFAELFNHFFKDFQVIDNFKSKNCMMEEFKNLKSNPNDFLKPLKPIENINEDFRIETEEGKKNLLEENKKYKEIVNLLEKKFNYAKLIYRDDYSINLHCKLCDYFICTGEDIIRFNFVKDENYNKNIIYIPSWPVFINNSDNNECDFVKECKNRNIKVDNYISCISNNHIYGGEYSNKYFITCFSNLYIKDFDGNKEDFDESFIKDNFQKLKNKINSTKKCFIKKKIIILYCD